VGGVHRSESTLFDLLMGEIGGFFAAGEPTSLWTARYCGCGRCHECAQMPVANVATQNVDVRFGPRPANQPGKQVFSPMIFLTLKTRIR
jgi:hypothetical protein